MYFAEQFRQLNRTKDRAIYVHHSNATDTKSNPSEWVANVPDDFLVENLRSAGVDSSIPLSLD